MNEDGLYRFGHSGVLTTKARCEDPDHRSYSGDRTWDECQFEAHAIETGLASKTWPAKVAIGSAVDEAVKAIVLDEPYDLHGLVGHYFEEYGCHPDDLRSAIGKAERLLALWEREVAPDWAARGVYAVEWELHWPIGGAVYHCHIDVAFKDGALTDLKTSDQRLDRTGNGRADRDVQLTSYADGIWRVFGHLPPEVLLDGLIDGNPPVDIKAWNPAAEKPWHDRQRATRTVEQLLAFEGDVARREAARRFARTTGLYQTQGRAHPWACNSCPAKSICPSWAGFVEQPNEGSIASVA